MANRFKPTRIRKQKARAKAAQSGADGENGSEANALVIDPAEQRDRKIRKQQMRDELRAQQPQMSSKKKKRLEKYIDTKLRKEETLGLLKKLGANVVDTSGFKSTKNLGISSQPKRAARGEGSEDEGPHVPANGQENGSSEGSEGETSEPTTPRALSNPQAAQNTAVASNPPSIGSGLKRPLEVDPDGLPIVTKKPRLKELARETPDEESDWHGFSSDSAQGSTSDESVSGESDISSNEGSIESSDSESNERTLSFPLAGAVKEQRLPARPAFRPRSDFKDWAEQQMNQARNFSPSVPTTELLHVAANPSIPPRAARSPERDPLPGELELPVNPVPREAYSVRIERSPAIQGARLKLPIVAEEQKIMESIHNNPAVVVTGSTGSGKTTQVPQFLYEAGYGSPDGPTPGMIGVTQPRRVAAVAMAERVGRELNNPAACSYQIRFDNTVGKQTAIKFMTDGILIREVAQDFALTKYSAIVVDEAHERSVNTDILVGLMSRIVDLRADMSRESKDVTPLKLVIMSATLMTDAFIKNSNLFRGAPPPLVESEGRQHPVTIHFARRTQRGYVEEAFRKVTKAHRKLPKGGILVFMTAQNEINILSKRLGASLKSDSPAAYTPKLRLSAKEAPLETEDMEIGDDRLAIDANSDAASDSEHDEEEKEFDIQEPVTSLFKVRVLPLYSQLPTKEQLRVFEEPPDGTRLIVLATNVAETSITIPSIRYVFDCGRAKERKYDKRTGVQSFEVGWISKASAAQRAGRAGRTGPGHCYRLYSSAVYERDFPEHTEPEILRMSAEGLVLQLKSMDLQHVVNFPFPTAPDRQSIARAERLLSYLGAIDMDGRVTPLGRDLSVYPVSPRFAKILAIGSQHNCIYLSVAMVAALAIPELFIPETQLGLTVTQNDEEVYTQAQSLEDMETAKRRKEYSRAQHFFSNQDKHADVLKLLSAFCAYAWAREFEDGDVFCDRIFLRSKAMKEAFHLYQQLLTIVAVNRPGSVDPKQPTIAVPTSVQKSALRQIGAAAFLDQVAIRADLAPSPPEMTRKAKRAIDVPYLTLFPSHEGHARTLDELAVYIHPSSVLTHTSPKSLPQFLVYSHLQRAAARTVGAEVAAPKTRMYPLTAIGPAQLCALARSTPLLQYSKPIGRVESVEGERSKRMAWVVPSLTSGSEGRSWPLPALKVLQTRDRNGSWVVERVEK